MASAARDAQGIPAADTGRGAALSPSSPPTIAIRKTDSRYPNGLLDLPHPPDPLWARGDIGILARPCVAIVGTRRATAYAERVTRELAHTMARAGA
ncbi:MAG: DNA-processing protein DprA, partial [bacterium]